MYRALLVATLLCLAGTAAMAQDPTKVASEHYKVEFENAQVRVLRIHYGPHEKTAMHSHPNNVVIFLTDAHVKFTTPDGKSVESSGKAGATAWNPAVTHVSENLSDQPIDGIIVELKSKPTATKLAAKPAVN
jgi:quercetin dioxygenase-like cupin family protein